MENALFTTKKCLMCGQEKPSTDFNKHSMSKDGLQTYCRDCQKRWSKEHKPKPAAVKPNALTADLVKNLEKKRQALAKLESEIKGIELAIKTLESYCK